MRLLVLPEVFHDPSKSYWKKRLCGINSFLLLDHLCERSKYLANDKFLDRLVQETWYCVE